MPPPLPLQPLWRPLDPIPVGSCAFRPLEHHLGNGLMVSGGFVRLVLRDDEALPFLPPVQRERLVLSLAGAERVGAAKQALRLCSSCGCRRPCPRREPLPRSTEDYRPP